MTVFISWSGERSKTVAQHMKSWLPDVLHDAAAWMSEHDIDAGARWSYKLSQVLEEAKLGVLCLTPENQKSPWLLYEAGALSKSLQQARLIPYLIGMSPSDVEPPLSQFQSVLANKDGTFKLLDSINIASPTPLAEERLKRYFERWWPDMEAQVNRVLQQSMPRPQVPSRSERELLTEVLQLVRSLIKNKDDNKPTTSQANCEGRYGIEVDTRPLLGEKGSLMQLEFGTQKTVTEFLNEIYFHMNEQKSLPPFTYGTLWFITNTRTNEILDHGAIQYCRSGGADVADTPLHRADIQFGDRLMVHGVIGEEHRKSKRREVDPKNWTTG